MELTNFQEKIQALEAAEDLIGLGRDASELRQEFEDFMIEAERVEQVKRLEAADQGLSYEEVDYRPLKEAFFEVFKSFQEKRKKTKVHYASPAKSKRRNKRNQGSLRFLCFLSCSNIQ